MKEWFSSFWMTLCCEVLNDIVTVFSLCCFLDHRLITGESLSTRRMSLNCVIGVCFVESIYRWDFKCERVPLIWLDCILRHCQIASSIDCLACGSLVYCFHKQHFFSRGLAWLTFFFLNMPTRHVIFIFVQQVVLCWTKFRYSVVYSWIQPFFYPVLRDLEKVLDYWMCMCVGFSGNSLSIVQLFKNSWWPTLMTCSKSDHGGLQSWSLDGLMDCGVTLVQCHIVFQRVPTNNRVMIWMVEDSGWI